MASEIFKIFIFFFIHSTVLEAEVMDNKTKTCPNAEMPVCLVGLRPFIGVQEIIASNSHLVLLSKADQKNNTENITGKNTATSISSNTDSSSDQEKTPKKWTLYNLSLPSPLALYKSMIELANLSRALNPQGYLELISEAHIVLRYETISFFDWNSNLLSGFVDKKSRQLSADK